MCIIALASRALLQTANCGKMCKDAHMDADKEVARYIILEARRLTGKSLSRLAREAGSAASTLTRFINKEDFKYTPSTSTLIKIQQIAGMRPGGVLTIDGEIAPEIAIEAAPAQETPTSQEPPTAVEPGVAVRDLGPHLGDSLDDLDEVALLRLWRALSITKKAAVFALLGIAEWPNSK